MGASNKGRKPSQSTREKLSAARLGLPLPAIVCLKISEARKGMKFSDAHRANLSAARRRGIDSGSVAKLSNEACAKIAASKIGKPRSAETKKKLSEANKGKLISDEVREKISESIKEHWKNRKRNQNANQTPGIQL
jgi:hypothetical protein